MPARSNFSSLRVHSSRHPSHLLLSCIFVDGGKVDADAGHLKFQKLINSDEIILSGLAHEKFLFAGDRAEGVQVAV